MLSTPTSSGDSECVQLTDQQYGVNERPDQNGLYTRTGCAVNQSLENWTRQLGQLSLKPYGGVMM